MHTLTTAAQEIESILSECESGDISEILVTEETLHLLRQALYSIQAEEAREEQAEAN